MRIAEVIASRLGVYLGAHTAKIAVRTFAQRAVGREPDELRVEDLPRLIDALKPMMNTLIGKQQCEAIVGNLRSEFHL